MLASWLSKDSHETLEPTGASLLSAADTLETNLFATSNNVKALERSTDPASGMFLTPHDDILADLQGHVPSGAPPEQPFLRPDHDPPLGSSLNLGSSAVETSLFTESLPHHEPPKEIMYDPSTGQRLHDYVPSPARSGADEELWSHLSHILELQSEIAKMHVNMESVGLRDARGHNGSVDPERGATADTTRSETRKHRRRNESLGEQEEDNETDEATEGESDGDDDVFGKKNREEEFTRLAERFANRKVDIDSVMEKLDSLSSALKTFHALPTPELDLASSRTNTMFSSASLTTARGTGGASVVSTAPTPPRLSVKPLVTTIIDKAQRVDSPLDMHPTQSIIDLGTR